MYFLPTTAVDLCREKWDIVASYLNETADAIAWANNWPRKAVQWGTPEHDASSSAAPTEYSNILNSSRSEEEMGQVSLL